ncbi:hypothetical protein DIURU_005168 [Diutina rugosa]|uniref:DNA damage checkpoint protein LCD1 n=1 Tax=Diutina rugosa TaxID=5481 RepID=A0A642ULF4_DIURU|nr:uncharacterized protein DIURU_005168 [Diutina rugosa]KAA8897569.1 hypothetical protein DIURU_005168 [Diutina rugosa]
MSDSEDSFRFSDDDDEILAAASRTQATPRTYTPATQPARVTPKPPSTATTDSTAASIYQAQGEASVLRAQLEQLQRQSLEERKQLIAQKQEATASLETQIAALKRAVTSLEDEKTFLNEALRQPRTTIAVPVNNQTPPTSTTVTKKRKLEDSSRVDAGYLTAVKRASEAGLVVDYLWTCGIEDTHNSRTCIDYLSKITVDEPISVDSFELKPHQSVAHCLTQWFMAHHHLRLDNFIAKLVKMLVSMCAILNERERPLAIPFLLTLVHRALTFRPLAVSKQLIRELVVQFSAAVRHRLGYISATSNHIDFVNFIGIPRHLLVLQKLILVVYGDLLETTVSLAAGHGADCVSEVWNAEILDPDVFRALPGIKERMADVGQINLVFNFISMLEASVTDTTFAYNNDGNEELVSSLFNLLVMEVGIRPQMRFHGLNRTVGNNHDFAMIDAMIPRDIDQNHQPLMVNPFPAAPVDETIDPQAQLAHETHLLTLKLRIAAVIDAYINEHESTDILGRDDTPKENFKRLIRAIDHEQLAIATYPRSPLVDLHLQIIGRLMATTYAITELTPDLSTLMFPQTVYELLVVFARVAFAQGGLTKSAEEIVVKLRAKGYQGPIFNSQVETRARNAFASDADAASSGYHYPNGVEFAYDADTIDIARSVLNKFASHDEADTLYECMHADG